MTACGLRDAAWGEALQRGLLGDALRDPERWGIQTLRTLGVRYADPIGTNYAQGAIGMAHHIGTLLHARMQSRTCAEAARVAGMSDATARRGANAAAPEPLPEEAAAPGALIFVASLASGHCRLSGASSGSRTHSPSFSPACHPARPRIPWIARHASARMGF